MANTATATGPLLIASEVAELLRISEYGVLRMARQGELPAVRIGKLVRFQRSDIDRFIAQAAARAS